MKQEDKELLLKDLCARLPYGVICHYNCVAEYDTMVLQKANCVNKLEGIIPFNGQIGYMVGGDKVNALSGDIKPYLRPLLSMTEEEKKIIADKCGFSFKGPVGGKIDLVMSILAVDWLIDFYNKNHFDYRGLIEKGLAIAVTEENNPYKE